MCLVSETTPTGSPTHFIVKEITETTACLTCQAGEWLKSKRSLRKQRRE